MSEAEYQRDWYHRRKLRDPQGYVRQLEKQKISKRAWRRRLRGQNPHAYSAAVRRDNLRRNYGISPEHYDALFAEQQGLCALCGKPPVEATGKLRLAVDHDHDTDQVRALLHPTCNMLLGLAHDDPEFLKLALRYLEKHKVVQGERT